MLLLLIPRFIFYPDIEAHIKEIQARKKEAQAESEAKKGVGLLESGDYYDSELYDATAAKNNKYEGYVTSIAPNDEADDDEDEGLPAHNNGQSLSGSSNKRSFNAAAQAMKEIVQVSLPIGIVSRQTNENKGICLISE